MSSGFISETDILEARRRRQEEWEKVRTEDQPKDAPEEEYDSRPLYQRLEEQKMRKDAEYEEAHKLKNMIRGLDDDEVGFLDLVERTKAQAAQQISMEEKKEMEQFRVYKSNLAEFDEISRLRAQLAPARTPQTGQTQKNKLQGVVVRKRKANENDNEKGKEVDSKKSNTENAANQTNQNGTLQCVGVLPGLGQYDTDSTSDSDDSSDCSSSAEHCLSKRDLLGRVDHDKKKDDNKS